MKTTWTEEELPQRSEAWSEWRKSCIGGSDAATVLGINPYEKPHTFWKRKTGRLKPKSQNKSMDHGKALEKDAGDVVCSYLSSTEGISHPKIEPICAVHPRNKVIGVSFDGVDTKNKYIVEIKCPHKVWNFRSVFEDGIQDYYYPQVQLQLYVAQAIWRIEQAYFCSYYPEGAYILNRFDFTEYKKNLAVIPIEYDKKYCAEMVKVLKVFMRMIEDDEWRPDEYQSALDIFNKRTNASNSR